MGRTVTHVAEYDDDGDLVRESTVTEHEPRFKLLPPQDVQRPLTRGNWCTCGTPWSSTLPSQCPAHPGSVTSMTNVISFNAAREARNTIGRSPSHWGA